MSLFGNILLARDKGLIVSNDDVLEMFVDRATISPPIVSGSSEYLTGTYQQPDLGTYIGDINDLTEAEIDDLAAGLDYDGAGVSVIWSTLEKVWILENLEVIGGGALRYGFSFTYDSGVSTVQVLNSGALGVNDFLDVPNGGAGSATDWVDTNVDGVADDWVIPRDTPTISTGSGFNSNFQRLDMTGTNSGVVSSNLFPIKSGVNYRLKFRYIGDTPEALTNVQIRDSASSATALNKMPVNTGNAIVYYSDEFSINDTQADVYIWFQNTGVVQYFGIDQVELIESATDFVDTNVDGLGDDWIDGVPGGADYNIITGSGFVNNAQSMEALAASNSLGSEVFEVSAATDYVLSIRYKLSAGATGLVSVTDSLSNTLLFEQIPVNTDNALLFQTSVFTTLTDTSIRVVFIADTVAGGILIFDEIELIKI